MKTLTNIIVFESKVTDEEKNACQKAGLNLYSQDEILSKGKACDSIKDKNAVINEPSPNDCSAFSYTSGTTGDPKGVKLTHKMLIGCSFAVMTRMAQTQTEIDGNVCEDDCYISYLPAAHSFEQAVMAMHIISGMKCGFYGGNVLTLTDDIALLKPTIFPSVPRLFNKIYSKIKDGLAKKEGAIGWLANKAVADKLWYLKNG